MTKRLLLALASVLVAGCDAADAPTGGPLEADGAATATLDGRTYEFYVYAQPSAYDPSEVVLRAYTDDLARTLMLTFDPEERQADVNTGMTGYWDLGLCTPSDAYVVAGPADASVRVTEHGADRLRGTFALRAESEHEPGDVVTFMDGSFDVRVAAEPFGYCIEG